MATPNREQIPLMEVHRKSPLSGNMNTIKLPVTDAQLNAYKTGRVLVQNAFPQLLPWEREFIQTGYTQEDWAQIFPPEEEEYEETEYERLSGQDDPRIDR